MVLDNRRLSRMTFFNLPTRPDALGRRCKNLAVLGDSGEVGALDGDDVEAFGIGSPLARTLLPPSL